MTLLLDALERSLREPQCASRWHNLLSVWHQTPDPATRQSVLDAIENLPDGDARADILRLTFLAGATGRAGFENAAAARVLMAEPPDPDRLASFMAYSWLNALQYLERRSDFVAAISAGRVPEMARCQMQTVVQLLPTNLVPRVPDSIKRIAVVLPYIGNQFHTPSMMAVAQCAVLASNGLQVRLFSAQELLPPEASLFRGDGRELSLPPLNVKAWVNILPAGMGMTVSDKRFSLLGRWRNLMPALADFDPDVVLLVGLYSPLAAALYTIRPVVGISVNSVPPIAPLDICLSADQHPKHAPVWGEIFPTPQTLYYPYRIRHSNLVSPVTRAEFGLDQTAMIWITAGFRLEQEIRGEWASRMLQLLSAYPRVTWLLVGGAGKLPQDLLQAAPGRIRALPTRNDLQGIFRCSDIFVNPPRMGGGFSVAEAMAEGLPVTAFAESDGGDKVGELAVSNLGAYMERLAKLTESPALRAEMGQTLRRRFAERYDLAAAGPTLLAACRQSASLARERLTRPS